MIKVINIPDTVLSERLLPDVQASGVRYVRTSRAVKAIKSTTHAVYYLTDGTQFEVNVGEWLCRVVNEDNYFVLTDDLFQLLFELPTP